MYARMDYPTHEVHRKVRPQGGSAIWYLVLGIIPGEVPNLLFSKAQNDDVFPRQGNIGKASRCREASNIGSLASMKREAQETLL